MFQVRSKPNKHKKKATVIHKNGDAHLTEINHVENMLIMIPRINQTVLNYTNFGTSV